MPIDLFWCSEHGAFYNWRPGVAGFSQCPSMGCPRMLTRAPAELEALWRLVGNITWGGPGRVANQLARQLGLLK